MSIKILLADDSITIQKVVGIIFGSEDYTLTVVDNGKAAVEKARELNPDVLLIDALMPGMSGYEVCEAVRATPSLATKPILLLTGSFEPFDETKAKNCGADDFLAKPFESQQIVTKVRELFDLGTSRAGTSTPSAPHVETKPVNSAFAEFEIEPDAESFAEKTMVTNDIWDAFTTPEESSSAVEPPPITAAPAAADEDIFSMITEEPEVLASHTETITPPPSEKASSLWIPVEEETFEFEEESAAEPTAATFSLPEPAIEKNAFEMDIPSSELLTTKIPDIPAHAASVTDHLHAPVFSNPAPAAMSEEQLRTALAGASKEVIERIVWEIVPDLAEIMIKEAIRKIKEGI